MQNVNFITSKTKRIKTNGGINCDAFGLMSWVMVCFCVLKCGCCFCVCVCLVGTERSFRVMKRRSGAETKSWPTIDLDQDKRDKCERVVEDLE